LSDDADDADHPGRTGQVQEASAADVLSARPRDSDPHGLRVYSPINTGLPGLPVNVGVVCAVAYCDGPHVVWRLGWLLVGGLGSRIRGWAWVHSQWESVLRWLRALMPMMPELLDRRPRIHAGTTPRARREQLRVGPALTAVLGRDVHIR
jgi:hypothetical protein